MGICYGPLICAGTYLVQRGSLPLSVGWLSVPLGVLIASFLWINEFPDFEADRRAGKKTLVVRLGRRRASAVFVALLGAAFLLLVLQPLAGLPRGLWAGALGLGPASLAATMLRRSYTRAAAIVPAQGQTLLSFLLLAVGSGVGLWAFR